jgi:hypothetical protein
MGGFYVTDPRRGCIEGFGRQPLVQAIAAPVQHFDKADPRSLKLCMSIIYAAGLAGRFISSSSIVDCSRSCSRRFRMSCPKHSWRAPHRSQSRRCILRRVSIVQSPRLKDTRPPTFSCTPHKMKFTGVVQRPSGFATAKLPSPSRPGKCAPLDRLCGPPPGC